MLHFSVCNCVRSWSQAPGLYWPGCDGFVLNEIDTPEKPNKVNFPQRTGQAHVGQNCMCHQSFAFCFAAAHAEERKKLLFKGTVAFLVSKNSKRSPSCVYTVPTHRRVTVLWMPCHPLVLAPCLFCVGYVVLLGGGKLPDSCRWGELTWFVSSSVSISLSVNPAHSYHKPQVPSFNSSCNYQWKTSQPSIQLYSYFSRTFSLCLLYLVFFIYYIFITGGSCAS